jgi:hypothetical protein
MASDSYFLFSEQLGLSSIFSNSSSSIHNNANSCSSASSYNSSSNSFNFLSVDCNGQVVPQLNCSGERRVKFCYNRGRHLRAAFSDRLPCLKRLLYREPECMPSRLNWVPLPLPCKRVWLPLRPTRLRGRGRGDPIRRLDWHSIY